MRVENTSKDIEVTDGKNPTQLDIIKNWCARNNFEIGEEWMKAGIFWMSNNSNEELDLWYQKYINDPTNRHKYSRHSRMEFGKFVDDGAGYIVNNELSKKQVLLNIADQIKRYEPSTADESDAIRIKHYLDVVEDYLDNVVNILFPLKQEYGTMLTQYPITITFSGLNVPVIGMLDYVFITDGEIKKAVELKTMWANPTKKKYKKDFKNHKQGERIWQKPSLPNAPMDKHFTQLALYGKALELDLDILYASESGAVLHEAQDFGEIQAEQLKSYLDYFRLKAITKQNLLKLVSDPRDLYMIIQPDFNNFKWKGIEPEYLKTAKAKWFNQGE